MTQIVNPSIDRVADSFLTAGSLAYAGLRDGGIVPAGQETQLATQSAADETVLNGFAFSTSGLDVTVSAGEAFVFGSWIIKDTQTTVTLPASSTTKVYVGWNKDAANSVIIGRVSDFEDEDAKIEVGEFTTDSSTVTSESDLREFVSIDAERLEGKDTSEITPDISDDGATVVENVDDINVEGFQAFEAFLVDDGATIVGPAEYTDSDAIGAVNNESSLSVNISGDANSVDGFSFVKDGNSGPGIINYQTGIEATGGTTVIDRTIGGVDYRIHAFESVGNSTFSVNQAPADATVDVLVVGGGGGSMGDVGGGGGAGGLVFNSNVSINSGSYSVSVGDGGDGAPVGKSFSADATSGQNSSISISGVEDAIGGGHGANYRGPNADSGGSGGGDTEETTSGSGTTGQGNKGGDLSGYTSHESSGGGGAGQAGEGGSSAPRDGGDGLYFGDKFTDTFGENGYFAGGGGGGSGQNNPETGGAGGLGGGGDGKDRATENNGNPGMPNTGGGGGGNAHPHYGGADGGSGIVLIRYEI